MSQQSQIDDLILQITIVNAGSSTPISQQYYKQFVMQRKKQIAKSRSKQKAQSFIHHPNLQAQSLEPIVYPAKTKNMSANHSRKQHTHKAVDREMYTDRIFGETSILSCNSNDHLNMRKNSSSGALSTSITMKNLRIVNHHLTSAKSAMYNAMSARSGGNEMPMLKQTLAATNNTSIARNQPMNIAVGGDCEFGDQENLDSNIKSQHLYDYEDTKADRNYQSVTQDHSSWTQCAKYQPAKIQAQNMNTKPQQDSPFNLSDKPNSLSDELPALPTFDLKAHEHQAQIQIPQYIMPQGIIFAEKESNYEQSLIQDWTPNCHSMPQDAKARKIFELEQLCSLIDDLELQFPQFIGLWNDRLRLLEKVPQIQHQIKQLEHSLLDFEEKAGRLKQTLFEHNRAFVNGNKNKEFENRSSKNAIVSEAAGWQEELRTKICSKADYEHVITFNQRVILPNSRENKNIRELYRQMFESQFTKKFVMIAKKQLALLTPYDSKLISEFFKKLQELDASYQKILRQEHLNNFANNENDFYLRLEPIIDEIQQVLVIIEATKSKIDRKTMQLKQICSALANCNSNINGCIRKYAKRISTDYMLQEGKSHDFTSLLAYKYEQEFNKFRRFHAQKSRIMSQLSRTEMNQQNIMEADGQSRMEVDDMSRTEGDGMSKNLESINNLSSNG